MQLLKDVKPDCSLHFYFYLSDMYIIKLLTIILIIINVYKMYNNVDPSCTKLFGTHTFYEGGGG